MKKFLITGVNGFLGRWISQYLLTEYREAYVFGVDTRVAEKGSVSGLRMIEADITNFAEVKEVVNDIDADVVYHLAASFDQSNLGELYEVNVLGTINLFEALQSCAKRGKKRVILASSAAVYGGDEQTHCRRLGEKAEIGPMNHYGVSKATMEMVSMLYFEKSSLDIVIGRLFNLIGPGLSERFFPGRLAKELAEIKQGLREPVIRVGNQMCTRDYLDGRDAARAFVNLGVIDTAFRVYNVASGVALPIKNLINYFVEAMDTKIKVVEDEKYYKAKEVRCSLADISRISADLSWSPVISIQQSIHDMINFYIC